MKIEFTQDWCMRMAVLEGDSSVTIGAHSRAVGAPLDGSGSAMVGVVSAFGMLIQTLRRQKNLSLEKLSIQTDVDANELKQIESDPAFVPDPRTVHFLSRFFQLPTKKLMQLSGLVAANDSHLLDEAVRFAASAKPGVNLTKDEKKALQEFLAVLNEQ